MRHLVLPVCLLLCFDVHAYSPRPKGKFGYSFGGNVERPRWTVLLFGPGRLKAEFHLGDNPDDEAERAMLKAIRPATRKLKGRPDHDHP